MSLGIQNIDFQTLKDLINLLKYKGLIKSLSDFAKQTEYNYTYLSRNSNNPEFFNAEFWDRVNNRYNLFTQDQLLELKYNSPDLVKEAPVIYETKNNTYRTLHNLKTIQVPIIPLKAHAKYIDEFYDEAADITFQYTQMHVDSYGKGHYLAFQIDGDSMNGGLIDDTPNGAIVLAREIGQHLWRSGLHKSRLGHIIVTNNNIVFKDIIDFNKKEMKVTCRSRNKNYQDFDLYLGYREDKETYARQVFKVIKRENM